MKRMDLDAGASSSTSSNPSTNPHNGRNYSDRYYSILEKRKTLPVWEQRAEFIKVFGSTQIMILQGETGSGKTTQVRPTSAQQPPRYFCCLLLATPC